MPKKKLTPAEAAEKAHCYRLAHHRDTFCLYDVPHPTNPDLLYSGYVYTDAQESIPWVDVITTKGAFRSSLSFRRFPTVNQYMKDVFEIVRKKLENPA